MGRLLAGARYAADGQGSRPLSVTLLVDGKATEIPGGQTVVLGPS